mmetsp:Transcript_9491/g.19436  ORF Transcript_9491/g.19436 Transcript_9491/m.19436 type:complete len:80 (+) Transcript_9491:284-523(+)
MGHTDGQWVPATLEIDPAVFTTLAVSLFAVGGVLSALFFALQATVDKEKWAGRVSLAILASIFLGWGAVFVLLANGIWF